MHLRRSLMMTELFAKSDLIEMQPLLIGVAFFIEYDYNLKQDLN